MHPVLRQVYANRVMGPDEDFKYPLQNLHVADKLTNISAAVELLERHIEKAGKILIVGDFDADGATSTAVCIRALRAMGAADVGYLVPNRFEFGYGLTPEITELAARQSPGLVITVDNGISSNAGVRRARDLGIDVLITDHHLPGAELPVANVIVNPNLSNDEFPSKSLAGVGVAFYVMLALRRHLRVKGWFSRRGIIEPNLAELLDLVALGTIADVVSLDYNNRILVAQGLQRIRAGRCQPGVQALIDIAEKSPGRITAADLGFALAPRLNAAGRLDDMSLGIECLLCSNFDQAAAMAGELNQLNIERREIETRMRDEALQAIRAMQFENPDNLPMGICLYDSEWHQGVVGLVASRIKDRVHRPVIAFADQDGQYLKGSARSIRGFHIRDALDSIAARYPGLISKFGGHAMAAGLSIKQNNLDEFRTAFAEQAEQTLTAEDLQGIIFSDGELASEYLTVDCANALRSAGPWGQGFPEPLFDNEFRILTRSVVGEKHLKLRLGDTSGGVQIDAIAFNQLGEHISQNAERVRVAYRLDVNEYMGRSRPQLIVEHLEAC
ncbi:MAG: single-stranded-DNA-specific exonuclease RecJ [Gammaproteobacteria bacterium]|nr:single-stranded-DNA-specific exonuclease RecJ [Gammaproteobacteria bacterium]